MRRGPARVSGSMGMAVALAAVAVAGCDASRPQTRPPTTVAPGGPGPVPPGPRPDQLAVAPGERRPEQASFLVRATSCERFADAVRPVAVAAVGPYGFAGGGGFGSGREMPSSAPPPAGARSAAPTSARAAQDTAAPTAGRDFSGTNVQEAGVDEPDTVKTDGRLLVSSLDGRLRVLDVSGEPRLVGTLELPQGSANLLLVGQRALVLSGGYRGRPGPGLAVLPDGTGGGPPPRPTTTVTVVDLTDPAKPTVARTHTIDGSYVDARLVGGVARIVTRSQPAISFPQPNGRVDPAKATAANAEVVRRADAGSFLPKDASCADAYVPVEASGVGTIAVQSLDPAAAAPGPAVTVVADASTVYASAGRLFVATNRYGGDGPVRPAVAPGQPSEGRTAIHAFDITDPARARYAGSGDVPGRLLNQFSLSEHEGVLRVATTIDGTGGGRGGGPEPGIPMPVPLPMPAADPGAPTSPDAAGGPGPPSPPTTTSATSSPSPGPVTTLAPPPATTPARPPSTGKVPPGPTESQSRVTILRPAGEEWVETGAVDGLGKGERIYAVRFLGTTGYVVTFRQVDPLYVLDLRDVRAPKVTGELKITGYSAYLHPAGVGRLLGIGQEANDQGRRLGTQLSLFDVRDPAKPTKLAGAVLSQGSSEAEEDHHAFLYWPANGLVVAPVTSYGGSDLGNRRGGPSGAQPFVGAVAFKVGDRSVAEAARISHPGSTPIERTLVVGDRLLTLSRIGLGANDLGSLGDRGFLPFR